MPLSHSQNLEGFGCGGASGAIISCHGQKRKNEHVAHDSHEEMTDGGDARWEPHVSFPKRQCLWHHQESQQQHLSQESLPGCLKNSSSSSSELSSSASTQSLMLSSSFLSSSLPQSIIAPLPRNLASNNLANHFMSRMRQKEEERGVHNQNNNYISEDDGVTMEEDHGLIAESHVSNVGSTINRNTTTTPIKDSSSSHLTESEQMESCMSMDSDYVPDTSQYLPSRTSSQTMTEDNCCDHSSWKCGYMTCRGLKRSPVSGRLHCHCSASWRGMYGLESGYSNDYY